jgi:hypothetical protein
MEATLRTTVQSFLDAMAIIFDKQSITELQALLTPDFNLSLAPASFMAAAGMPADFSLSKDGWSAHLNSHMPVITSTKMTVFDTIVEATGRKAAVHLNHAVEIRGGAGTTLENVLMLHFTEDGTKVRKVVEFTDVDTTKKYMGLVAEAKKALENKD